MKPLLLSLAVGQAMLLTITPAFANESPADENVHVLETIEVIANANEEGYASTHAEYVTKSTTPLFETAQSISVVGAEKLTEKQATTLAEAVESVAGVQSGQYGRRGWDDLIIRGQLASGQILLDGMRTATSRNFLNGLEISGLESVEVIKGPATVNFGQMMPGGAVNLTTKRPRNENFARATLSYGSEEFKHATVDVNYAPNGTSKGAFRFNARISDQNDATDYVYFKNQYFAPSYSFNFGENTDLVVTASAQFREYLRQQGLPLVGSLYPNSNATYGRNRFAGEPDAVTKDTVYRFGYNFIHNFSNDWKLRQNFSYANRESDADSILARGNIFQDLNSTQVTLLRSITEQLKKDDMFTLDTSFGGLAKTGSLEHHLLFGLDTLNERSHYIRKNWNYSNLNLNNPVYGVGIKNRQTANDNNINYLRFLGFYLKDNIYYRNWILGLSARHDWTQVETYNVNTSSTSKNSDNAFTGSTSLMYNWNDWLAPYMSFSTSFLPNTDQDENGSLLDPEKGRQFEVGVKLQSPSKRIQGAIAYYDLTRKNVAEALTATNGSTYYDLIGEQRTKGFEAEVSGSLNEHWNINAAYSYIPTAKITQSTNANDIGRRFNLVPKNSLTLSSRYFFNSDHTGWNIGASARYVDERISSRGNAYAALPSYVLYDALAGYEAKHWGASLSVKNIFDKAYFSGTTPNATLVNFGEPRNIRFNLNFKY